MLKTVLLVLAFFVVLGAASVNTFGYVFTFNPPYSFVDLENDPMAINVTNSFDDDTDIILNFTSDGDLFQFPFYGVDVKGSSIVWDSNGYLSFFGLTNENFQPICPFPDLLSNASNSDSFDRGFAFFWTDYDINKGGRAFYRFFTTGGCPYGPRASDACLVICYKGVSSFSRTLLGDINAILFPNGDMLGQIQTYNDTFNGTWGDPSFGAVIGIQDVFLGEGLTFPNDTCLSGNATGFVAPLVPLGSTLAYMIGRSSSAASALAVNTLLMSALVGLMCLLLLTNK